jgi:diadenosine tetraphosphate (Ap4A) HIT family hydrolase
MDTYILMDEKGPELKELGSELARIEKEAIQLFRKRSYIWLMLSDSPAGQFYMRVHGSADTYLCYIER